MHIATTCSRIGPQEGIRITSCPQAHTCSILRKRVRSPLRFCCSQRLTYAIFSRCRNRCYDKPHMGCQSQDVHHAPRQPAILPRSLGWVWPSVIHWARISFCSFSDGLRTIYKTEGIPGLYRGTLLALFGVSNGAIQFMVYEKMKEWGFARQRKQFAQAGRQYTPADDKLVRSPEDVSSPSDMQSTVEYLIHNHVRCQQALGPVTDIPVSSSPIAHPGRYLSWCGSDERRR